MSVIKGIRQSFFAKRNTLFSNPPTYPFAPGLGNDFTLTFDDEGITEYRGGDLPFRVNHKFEGRSFQTIIRDLSVIMQDYCFNGVDAQIVSNKSSGSTYAGVYNYSGNKRFFGFDFEYLIASKERSLKFTAEVALDADEHLQMMQDSIVASPIDISAFSLGNRGEQTANYRKPNFSALYSPTYPTSFVNGYEIVDRKFLMKTNSSKMEDNRSDVNYIEVSLELTINKAYAWDLVDYLNKSKFGLVQLEERISPTIVERFKFDTGVLIRTGSFELGADKRLQKFVFKRNIPITDFIFDIPGNLITVTETV